MVRLTGSNEYFSVNGQRAAPEQSSLSAQNLPLTTVVAGNSIIDALQYAVNTTAPGSPNLSYTWQTITILDPALAYLKKAIPTAADVVAAGRAMAAFYGNIPNPNDCGWITDATAAAAGAPMPVRDQSIDPRQNEEGGFWRIAHRGTDHALAKWESLIRPGDIVRFDWADPAQPQHTTLYLTGEGADGKATIFDNLNWVNGRNVLSIHQIDLDSGLVNPASVTVYRLTTDARYLINGTTSGDILVGTSNNDLFRGKEVMTHFTEGLALTSRTLPVRGQATAFLSWQMGRRLRRTGHDRRYRHLISVERIRFTDVTLAFDDGAAQVYRLYQAAFSRTPDKAGLSYWVDKLGDGLSMRDIAYGFMNSAEFMSAFGANPTNSQLVRQLYLNILEREPERAGADYWTQTLNTGANRLDVFAAISESGENKAKVAPLIGQGIELDTAIVK